MKFGCYCIKFPPKNIVNCSMQSGQNPLKCQWIRHHRSPSLLLLFLLSYILHYNSSFVIINAVFYDLGIGLLGSYGDHSDDEGSLKKTMLLKIY